MITIKLQYSTSQENIDKINTLQRQQSAVFRWAYNRVKEEIKEKEIRHLSKNLNNINNLDSWFIQCAIKDAMQQVKSENALKIDKTIFGSKFKFFQLISGKISKDEWKETRLRPITIQGEASKSGNRKFTFKIIEENKIIFKPNRNEKIEFFLPKLRKNYKNQLFRLQQLMEQKQIPVAIKLNKSNIYISFDLDDEPEKKYEGNYIGIDLNPNYISCVLFDKNKKLLKSWNWNLSKLTKHFNQNKILFESIEIAKQITKLCIENNVDFVFVENLEFKSGSLGKGKKINKLCLNSWPRAQFVNNLKKRCNSNKIKLFEVNAAYSSTIGNIMYGLPDSISAACEIARRGYECIILKTKEFYPKLQASLITSQWKDLLLNNEFASWKEIHCFIKNSKLKYRVSWSDDYVFRNFITKRSLCSYNCYNYTANVI